MQNYCNWHNHSSQIESRTKQANLYNDQVGNIYFKTWSNFTSKPISLREQSSTFDKFFTKHLDNKFNTCFKYPNFKFFLISPFSPWEASQGSSHCYFLSTECSSKRIHELSKQLRHDLRCWGQQLSKYHPQCVNKSKGLKSKPIEMNRWIFKKSN